MTPSNDGMISSNVYSGTCVTGATDAINKRFSGITSLYNDNSPFREVDSVYPDWNVAAVLSGDGTERFTLNSFYCSSSLDVASVGFCNLSWSTLHIE